VPLSGTAPPPLENNKNSFSYRTQRLDSASTNSVSHSSSTSSFNHFSILDSDVSLNSPTSWCGSLPDVTTKATISKERAHRERWLNLAFKEIKNGSAPQILTEKKVRTLRPLRKLILKIDIITKNKNIAVDTLLDSGANGIFIDTKWAKSQCIPLKPLELVVPVYNIDETINLAGGIAYTTKIIIDYKGYREKLMIDVTNRGWKQIIIRYIWLREHNSMINWVNGTVNLKQCPTSSKALKVSYGNRMEEAEKDHLRQIHENKEPSEGIESEAAFKLVPLEYHKFLDVFSKKASKHMPEI
jgi:hypothetical protein